MSASDVARAFGLGTPACELTHVARGAMGEVFRLDTDRGPFAVKRLFWGPTGDEQGNVAFQLAAFDAGVPLPRPLLDGAGNAVAQLADDAWWRAYEWADGEPYTDKPAEAAVAVKVARALGLLHALKYDAGTTIDPWYWDPLGADRIRSAVDVALAHGWKVEERAEELVRLDAVVAAAPEADAVGCHHDTGTTNALVDADANLVLVDWDNAGPGVAEREFASALLQWACDDNDVADEAVVRAMVEAYRAAGASFAPRDLSVFATRCSSWVHYVVMCCEHLADPDSDPDHLAFEQRTLRNLETCSRDTDRLVSLLEMIPA